MLRGEFSTAKNFMSTRLVRTFSNSNVSKAVKMMVEFNVGSVIVDDNEGPVGVFTERDLITKVLARQKKLEEPILLEVMTSSFDTLNQDATLLDSAKIMREKKGRLMVFDDGNLVGIVTATDIVREIAKFGKPFDFKSAYSGRVYEESPVAKMELIVQLMAKRRIGSVIISYKNVPSGIFTERDLLRSILKSDFSMDSKVEDYATRNLVTARYDINGLDAARMMVEKHIKRLPLIRSGKLVGIVTARDLVEAFADSSW